LSGVSVDAYEIHHGHTSPTQQSGPARPPALLPVLPEQCGWQRGQALAIYLHGLFESPAVMRALFGRDTPTLDDTLNGLADFIDTHFAPGALRSLLE
jgi:adenosylcobyric acid synthase